MTYEEFTNTTDREFDDISGESQLEYELFHQDKSIVIDDPIAIHIDERRNYHRHLVVSGNGQIRRIPFNPNVDLLGWITDKDVEQIVI